MCAEMKYMNWCESLNVSLFERTEIFFALLAVKIVKNSVACLWVFRFICFVTAYLVSSCFLIFSFQITGDYLAQFQVPRFTDEQTEWCSPSRSPTEAELMPPREVCRDPLNTEFKGGKANFGVPPAFILTFWFLDQNSCIPVLSWLTRCLIFKHGWSFFLWKTQFLPYLPPGTTAEEPWPCREPLHAKWDLIFPKYLGEEKQ